VAVDVRPLIDAYASQENYVDHLLPIWEALPESVRGRFHVVGDAQNRMSYWPSLRSQPLLKRQGDPRCLTLVASYQDEQFVRPRPTVLVEHGAGQSYSDHDPSYPGGSDRRAVQLFICPNETVAQRWRDMYPETPTAVVGCPKLDPWHAVAANGVRWGSSTEVGELPLVVISFHFQPATKTHIPEARPAFEHYMDAVEALAHQDDKTRGFRLAGHHHPRAHEIGGWMRAPARGPMKVYQRFETVLDLADVYVCDNSSTIYEFASTDRPVVLLNAPWYRRDVEHGLRFWALADVGLQCDLPIELHATILDAIKDHRMVRAQRYVTSRKVYAHVDGRAAARAAVAILEVWAEGRWEQYAHGRPAHDPFAPHR